MGKQDDAKTRDDSGANTVTLTMDQVRDLMAGAAEQAVKTQRGNVGIDTTTATQEQRVAAELGKPIPDRTPHREWLIPCRNEDNGATFKARVVASRTFPSGRVLDLVDYAYPADIETRIRGMSVRDTKSGGYTIQFKQWRFETYDQADRRQYVGKAASRLPKSGEPIPVVPNLPGNDENAETAAE